MGVTKTSTPDGNYEVKKMLNLFFVRISNLKFDECENQTF